MRRSPRGRTARRRPAGPRRPAGRRPRGPPSAGPPRPAASPRRRRPPRPAAGAPGSGRSAGCAARPAGRCRGRSARWWPAGSRPAQAPRARRARHAVRAATRAPPPAACGPVGRVGPDRLVYANGRGTGRDRSPGRTRPAVAVVPQEPPPCPSRATAARTRTRRRRRRSTPESKVSPKWLVPVMVACFVIGLAWIVVYYLTTGMNIPVHDRPGQLEPGGRLRLLRRRLRPGHPVALTRALTGCAGWPVIAVPGLKAPRVVGSGPLTVIMGGVDRPLNSR